MSIKTEMKTVRTLNNFVWNVKRNAIAFKFGIILNFAQ